jgi:5-methyltetrahydropteroyltriglutamate--homocysteine methyltransferase
MSNDKLTPQRPARPVARAEFVGSLLRPKAITDLIDSIYGDMTTASKPFALDKQSLQMQRLTALADNEIARAVRRQIDCGLDVVTDGELRRSTFLSSFYDSVDGFGPSPTRFEVKDEQGNVAYSGYADPVVIGPLRKAASPLAEEATFLRGITDFPFKLTIPAPSYFLTDFVDVPASVYPSRRQFLDDVIQIERRLILEAIAAGARWIQFDFPIYPGLVDPQYAAKLVQMNGCKDVGALLGIALKADNQVTASLPEEITVGLHLCRGNLEGGFWSGSLAPIAERMFSELVHDRFLFEWEDVRRAGSFEPIKHVPKGRIMAMGIVSTKRPEVETVEQLIRQLEEAARYLPIDQLALCTQCGFASLCGDHLVQVEDSQWRKLEVIGRVADKVWGAR